jgi:hypothetical protein
MRYTFMLHSTETNPGDQISDQTGEKMAESLLTFGAYINDLREAGVFVDTDWLQPSSTATTVSMENGVPKILDGPYADTKEQIGGYFVVEVPDLDAALAWAQKCPVAYFGHVEVRPSAMPEGQL